MANWTIHALALGAGLDSGRLAALAPLFAPVNNSSTKAAAPGFFRGSFVIAAGELADTYLDMSGWERGNLFVNGHHLARYRNEGPQFTHYCPASWLREGAANKNEVVLFETMGAAHNATISFRSEHKKV